MWPPVFADDTCVFTVTADDVPPNIVLLLDNGAEMEQIVWHHAYDNSVDYTPAVSEALDAVANGVDVGNGFFNDNGYGIISHGGSYYLVPILDNLEIGSRNDGIEADSGSIWTLNGRSITLPTSPSAVAVDGIIDNATHFRYSKNYLNWLFFYTIEADLDSDGQPEPLYNFTDLPNKSRFYFAKKGIMTVAKLAENKANFGIYNFTSNADGASNVQPLGLVVDTPLAAQPENNALDPNFVNNVNNMGTVTYSPIAEGLARVGGYYSSPSSGVVGYYCQKNFVIVVTPGVSSEDQACASSSSPASLSDYDEDNAAGIGEGNIKEDADIYTIPTNQNGSTYLDDVAQYLYTHDIVDYRDGFQNILTYTIGFMGDQVGNLFLINTSNNGNGNINLYDTSHKEYGKYHYVAEDPYKLSSALLSAVNDILSATSSFTAPVVPVTRTTSGNRIYMAFFKPGEGNFWEGNVTRFGISSSNEIVDKNGNAATWPNGAVKEDAEPYWATKDWADSTKNNYIHNLSRNIYTYLGYSTDLTDSTNEFISSNTGLTATLLGNPAHTRAEIINYVRGADMLDEDSDGDTSENRTIITGDVLHSEPLVVQYDFPDNTSKTIVYFGSNDGMLHAVLDSVDPDRDTDNDETSYGTEEWAFIPPDQLHRLKDMVEGYGHQYFVDSSPKAFIKDVNQNGIIELNVDSDEDGDVDDDDKDQVILICGERKGGTSYFALDVTDPSAPKFLWRISQHNDKVGSLTLGSIFSNNGGSLQDGDQLRIWDYAGGWGDIAARVDGTLTGNVLCYEDRNIPFAVGEWIGNLTTEVYQNYVSGGTATPFVWGQILSITNTDPDVVIPELGETWSEPQFGLVKTTDTDTIGTPVFFIGGGYSTDNSVGKAVMAINVFTGHLVKMFKNETATTGMDYSIVSSVTVIDADNNGFVDKVYIGDLGSQMWRLGKFTDVSGNPFGFPNCDENIMNWTAQRIFLADSTHTRKFHYPPSVTLEKGYDMVFMGTGDREEPCDATSSDRVYAMKDTHTANIFEESDLVDVTDPTATKPDLDNETGDVDGNSQVDQGWYIRLAAGEKYLSEGTVFYKIFYATTFTPNNDPCLPGGIGKLYALSHKKGGAGVDFDGDGDTDLSLDIGGGIPSKPVIVITDSGGTKMFVSVGSTNPDANSEAFDAGIVAVDPLAPNINFFYLWWRELFNGS
jgi:hypothetical protein